MVHVCVTTFKGRHKIQSRWENREYVMEWQPYPNLPVYVVHPIDSEGHRHTLHRHYLLSISNNLEQEADDNSVEGDGPSVEPTPVLHENDALPANCLTKSQLEGMLSSSSEQHELFDQGSTRSISKVPTDEGLQADNDAPIPPRQSSRTMRRYWNFCITVN